MEKGSIFMRVSELGEFGLIERIAASLPSVPPDVVMGIGDDVAVLKTGGREYLLATCDIQVENVHFVLSWTTPYQLGRKIVAINVSDIAAMGGAPAWALVSLALPPTTEVRFVDELYRGIQDQLTQGGATLVGGNLSKVRSEVLIDFFLLGKAAPKEVVFRNGAKEGDVVMVTGTLGESRAGLELLRRSLTKVSLQTRRTVEARHLTPQPRLQEGLLLGRSGKVHAMLDVSDGLLSDLRHICRAGGVGAELWVSDIPISQACREVAQATEQNSQDWALMGGEDYELLFTLPPEAAPEVGKRVEEETGTPCRIVGRIVSETLGIQMIHPKGRVVSASLETMGWDHFASLSND